MYALIRPLIFLLPAETAHRLVMAVMRLLARTGLVALIRRDVSDPRLRTEVFGLRFDSPIGLAAGLDKDGEAVRGWEALGFGFVEVGTVTPRPQPGNPPPRLFRLREDAALVNRMGFNNHGAEAMARALASPHSRPLGVNLGKNKDTPLERAADDYLAAFHALADRGDYFVINVSSPNTPGLRSLQSVEALGEIVRPVLQARDGLTMRKPILVKLAPDLSNEDAIELARACETWGVDGLVVSNTTLRREGLRSNPALAAEAGGLSGAPVRARSTELIRVLAGATPLPIIGVGGVFDGREAYEKIRAGASLVQVYTGFIYGGPGTPSRIARELSDLLAKDGFPSVREAIGADQNRLK